MPEPVALVTAIQPTLLTALQVQLVPVVTDSELVLPIEGTVSLVGVTDTPQPVPDWVNVTVCPPTVIVPVRSTPVELAATV
jgi:hypothetical protein